MNGMDDLITWLRAQLDEDERVAREATIGPWSWGPMVGNRINWALSGPDAPYGGFVLGVTDAGCPSTHDAEHIARWDPARVLAEVDAKRRILDYCATMLRNDRITNSHSNLLFDLTREGLKGLAIQAEIVLRLLALPYAAQPGYLDEWRP